MRSLIGESRKPSMPKNRSNRPPAEKASQTRRAGYEEGDVLTPEDEKILDGVWDEIAQDERVRREQYAPVITTIVQWLKQLDAEAVPLPNGNPVGLWWYARHLRRDEAKPKNCRNEEDWSRRIKDLMTAQGIPATCERFYPAPPKRRCDLVIEWPGLGRVWLEVKGAWRHNDSGGTLKNPSYRKHLCAATDDLDKVCSLDSATAEHVGLLLIGFDTSDEPISEDDVELVGSNARRQGWIKQQVSWPDLNRRNGRIHVWLWLMSTNIPRDMFGR
jgi:hypothetical protein